MLNHVLPVRPKQQSGAALISKTSFLKQACIIVPTYNASPYWKAFQEGLDRQGIEKHQVLVIDSSSSDTTPSLVRNAGYSLVTIPKETFSHGGTRQMAAEYLSWAEFLVFFTQDSICSADDSIETLLYAFNNPEVGGAYGRQLPRRNAGPIEHHARMFNYPAVSQLRDLSSKDHLGIKAAFFSNSFAAYRRDAFFAAGGFPKDAIVSEDLLVAARMLQCGWKIAYQADATVTHSHPLTLWQEFSRYFDIGVQHGKNRWVTEEFGKAHGEGYRFVVSQLQFLREKAPFLISIAMIRTFSKLISYQLGAHERYLPAWLKRFISDHPNHWRTATPPEEIDQETGQDPVTRTF